MSKKTLASALLFALLTLPSLSYAERIGLGGDQKEITLTQESEITKTEYTYEPYETTCSREVVIGKDTKCETRYENKCEKVPGVGAVCHNEPSTQCTQVDRTKTEQYACTKYMKTPYQVHDYNIRANVLFTKSDNAKNFDLSECEVGVELKESTDKFYALCGSAIVKARVLERKETMSRRDKSRTMKVALDFASLEDLAVLKYGLSTLSYDRGTVSFYTANLEKAQNFTLSMSITRNRFLLKDKLIFSKNLKPADYRLDESEYGSADVSVDLARLDGDFDSTKKHTINVVLKTTKKVDLQGAINTPELTNEISRSIVVNE